MSIWLTRWALFHAVLTLLATTVSWVWWTPWPLPISGTFSFLLLILGSWRLWTGGGTFGLANVLTGIRLAGVVTIPFLFPFVAAGTVTKLGVTILLLDGLDGWVARRRNEASQFGEYFDKETDALLLLVLCTLAVLDRRLGAWFLLPGLLRYIFVLFAHLLPLRFLGEQKTHRARVLYSLGMAGGLAAFLPYPRFYTPLAVLGTLGLFLSFSIDFSQLFIPLDHRKA